MYSEFPAITKTTPANHVPEILQPQHSINTSANPEGCQISSVKTKSIWQTSLWKLKNHFWKVQVKWINCSVQPTPNIPQTPKLPWWGQDFLLKNIEWWRVSTDWTLVSWNTFWRTPKMQYIVSQKLRTKIPEKSVQKSLNICKDPCRSAVVLT